MATALATTTSAATHPLAWWRGAVIYQIYPRSFRDTNGDGIGDLAGIAEGLDYIAGLGVDGIWISPFFTSPMRDFGYDVADYCGIDPSFGCFADFDRIIEKAHGLGLKVIIDQVYSHTSDEHAWFRESRQDRTNPKADWYVWADPKPDGSPPSNWQSVFGGSAWQWDGPRKQYYLHNFLTSQPDLNVHNPDVQEALLDVARFWLERGVDGFRLDALNFSMHDPELRDNPPSDLPMELVTRPFDMQIKRYNQSHPDITAFLERIRQTIDEFPGRFTVAEVGGPEPLAEMKAFTAGGKRLDSAYNFDFLYAPRITAPLVRASLSQWSGEPGEGWPSWAFSNHDAPRAVTRWTLGGDMARMARLNMLLLLALRGNPIIYQGEELGLPQGEVAFEDLLDPEAIANWPHTLGRDGARTPMPWQALAPQAGFSSANRTWLKRDPAHAELAVDRQTEDPRSTLRYTRKLLRLRKQHPALVCGDMTLLDTPEAIVAFVRHEGESAVLCAFNLSDEALDWTPPEDFVDACLLASESDVDEPAKPPMVLAPGSGYWAASKAEQA
ncbi:alpha-amylase family glycosyl hydrolase [Erythrobacter dokdonensis]|uniref:Alpha amylase family protein n=1 Tax=Erythrobacter dokdonensis DSW-74 TaxID=1300349 RepID=A0A1A7BGR5_9SPHN|nr:alpha-amylase family glycosyl hydrolase [Erythrobacter dokdonensis]OBV10405.1 Alpha amylase family protein [Erythrobacter dokdonensis DSW-74]